MASGDVWDVPDTPIGWTPQGCDQSDLVRCHIRHCGTVLRSETVGDHMWLTHGMIYRPEDDGATEQSDGR